MAGIKELKTRIRSIGSTRKITRAMQMVSAAKMRKAQNATLASRTYSSLAWELIRNLTSSDVILRSGSDEGSQPENEILHSVQNDANKTAVEMANALLRQYPKAKKIGVILLTTNRGLVGSLNSNLMAKVKEITSPSLSSEKERNGPISLLAEEGLREVIAEIIAYGKNAKTITGRLGKKIVADFPKQDKTITTEDIYPLAKYITDLYKTGQYKKIVIIYNHFVSTLIQKPTLKQLLPFASELNPQPSTLNPTFDYLFEPDPTAVLEHLLPRIIESQIYQAILESNASEHSARMVMMKNATEAAGDLISDLTLTYNQLRQNKITTELAEITAGRIALE